MMSSNSGDAGEIMRIVKYKHLASAYLPGQGRQSLAKYAFILIILNSNLTTEQLDFSLFLGADALQQQ